MRRGRNKVDRQAEIAKAWLNQTVTAKRSGTETWSSKVERDYISTDWVKLGRREGAGRLPGKLVDRNVISIITDESPIRYTPRW